MSTFRRERRPFGQPSKTEVILMRVKMSPSRYVVLLASLKRDLKATGPLDTWSKVLIALALSDQFWKFLNKLLELVGN